MFKINKDSNRISRLEEKRFTDLRFTERDHLQEWLANEPDALGEDLLIIQKEFDGFEDTRERLDLLALDKEGNIVVVENKLDDSGRDVVWQALKYASYCANLSKLQIVEIFQEHLGAEGGNAHEAICAFMDETDLEEVTLNSSNSQRVIFVAANFRKEVTSTALWLLGHGVQIQCFKVTPYSMGEDLFLNVEQIIPTPEVKELMIGRRAKEAEEKTTEHESKRRYGIRFAFWEQALVKMRDSECDLFNNISPSKDHWLSAGSGVRNCPFQLIFGSRMARVQFNMGRPKKEENKFIFDELESRKGKIEEIFGERIEWLKLNEQKASRIQYEKEFDGYNEDNWPEIIEWMVENMIRLENALTAILIDVNKKLARSEYSTEYSVHQ